MKILFATAILILAASVSAMSRDRSASLAPVSVSAHASGAGLQSGCLDVLPAPPVAVAPGQPAIGSQSAATPDQTGTKTATPTAGIINALCDVTLDIVGCSFSPNIVTVGCDTNGDGTPDLLIPLTNVTAVDGNLTQATLSTSQSGLSGSAFPLSCCGGFVALTLELSVTAGDNNIFGPFTETQICTIDVGQRAPVVISASPSQANCAIGQDILIPGSCFILPNSVPNVTGVFAVDSTDSTKVIQASTFTVLSPTLIDALFSFGSQNAGETFLIFATGPNGTSRNLTALPEGIPSTCPLGNEVGIQVTVSCEPAPAVNVTPSIIAVVNGCFTGRNAAGKEVLTITGSNIQQGAAVTVNQGMAKSVTFTDFVASTNTYNKVLLKGKFCKLLPGPIVITNPNQPASVPFQCNSTCN
ncbi:MAG TPA: hypothetical protein VLZ81_01920 [Blastocatellia bacterium]|nr:hypothetical protein [Blastocatellia bacterium]